VIGPKTAVAAHGDGPVEAPKRNRSAGMAQTVVVRTSKAALASRKGRGSPARAVGPTPTAGRTTAGKGVSGSLARPSALAAMVIVLLVVGMGARSGGDQAKVLERTRDRRPRALRSQDIRTLVLGER
jgi:hypothetical protein